MALSGSFTKSINSYLSIKVTWSATQSISANTSKVTVKAYAVRGAYGYNTASSHAWTMYIDGTKYTGTASFGGANNSQTLLAAESKTITHNADGTRTFSISFAQALNITFSGNYIGTVYSGDHSFSLTAIPRASTWVTAPSFTLGDSPTVKIKINSSSYTHILSLFVGASRIAQWTGITTASNKLTFTADQIADLQTRMGTNTSMSVIWGLGTFDGSTQVGETQWKTVTLTLNASSSAPVINSITYTESNAQAKAMVSGDQVVQGLSELQVTVSATAQAGATIGSAGIVVTADGVSYFADATTGMVTLDPPAGTGTYTVYTTVEDSRGFTTSTSKDFTVITYAKPTVKSAIAQRTNASGTAQGDGQYLSVTFSAATSALAGTGITADITYQVATSDTPSSSWSTGVTNTYSGNSTTATVTLSQTFQGTSPYYVRLVITDAKGGTSSAILAVGTAQVLMSWSKTRVGIGKVATQGVLDIGGDTYISGALSASSLKVNGESITPVASPVSENTNGASFTWGSGWKSYSSNDNTNAWRYGDMASLTAMITASATPAGSNTLCTLPAAYHPLRTVHFAGAITDAKVANNWACYGAINTEGKVTLTIIPTGARVSGAVVSFAASWNVE